MISLFEYDLTTELERNEILKNKKFSEIKFQRLDSVITRSFLYWGEHCIQCQMPLCYYTCDLYKPRTNQKCRTFLYGIFLMKKEGASFGYIGDIYFKQNSALWTSGNITQLKLSFLNSLECLEYRLNRIKYWITKFLLQIRLIYLNNIIEKIYYQFWKNFVKLFSHLDGSRLPNFFLLEVFNPNLFDVGLKLTITERKQKQIKFEWGETLKPGFNRQLIKFSDIMKYVDDIGGVEITITRNQPTRLIFAACDFVYIPKLNYKSKNQIKCVIWDLDNTIWDGVLVENNDPNHIPKLKPGIYEILQELDRSGILLSIASKNNYKEVKQILEKLGLWKFFLYPKINWNPKSSNIIQIQKSLNIGYDSIAFIDDSEFELKEVKNYLPKVNCFNASNYKQLIKLPEFSGSTTKTSKSRRILYSLEQNRNIFKENFEGDYNAFLESCSINITLRQLKTPDTQRVQELIQRTNQMNFSGNRYNRKDMVGILNDKSKLKILIEVKDKFGNYGIVGFAIITKNVEQKSLMVSDLVFSCRVQSKKIEHRFLTTLAELFVKRGYKKMVINYNETPRNTHLKTILEELNFKFPKFKEPFLSLDNSYQKYDFINITIEEYLISNNFDC